MRSPGTFLYHLIMPAPQRNKMLTEEELSVMHVITGHEFRECVRDELFGKPKLAGFRGPMWDGYKEGTAVIRYEQLQGKIKHS